MKRSNVVAAIFTLVCIFLFSSTASAFKKDPAALGEWKSVDFVPSISDFQPGFKCCKKDLYLKTFLFDEGGSTQNEAFTWTRGKVYYSEWSRNGKYEIKNLGGVEFLFLEWINGDVAKRNAKPCYYVFVKKGSDYAVNTPFVDDPEVIGKWETVDFVDTMDRFDPSSKRWTGELFLKSLDFNEEGTVLCSNKKVKSYQKNWTKGNVNPNSQWPAHYSIKVIEGQFYMFYEWISGDVTKRGKKPSYYVLKRR